MTVNEKESIFPEKYRPKTLDDIILPQGTKTQIKDWIKNKNMPNLLLVSRTPGLGKSSLAHVLINEFNADALFINISLNNNIDVLRTKIQGFVSTISFSGSEKFVILDEADGMGHTLQKSLRGFIEEFSQNARFILTANYSEKILDPLKDRLQVLDFDEMFTVHKKELIKDTAQRLIEILKHEGIDYKKEDVLKLIRSTYPSNRSLMIKLQESIVNGILEVKEDDKGTLDDVIQALVQKNFSSYREQITHLSDPSAVFTEVYNQLHKFKDNPKIVILTAKYAYQDSLTRDRLVNVAAYGAEVINVLESR